MSDQESSNVLIGKLMAPLQNNFLAQMLNLTSQHKIMTQIKDRQIKLPQQRQACSQHISFAIKKAALQQIFQSDDYYTYQKDLILMKGYPLSYLPVHNKSRKQQLEEIRQKNQQKANQATIHEFEEKRKKWLAEKNSIQEKKQLEALKKKSLQEEQKKKLAFQQQKIEEAQKILKRKQIQKRMKLIAQRKQKRQELMYQSPIIKKHYSLPKYIEFQHQFQKQQKHREKELKKQLDKIRQAHKVSMEEVKQHERAYVQKIKQRLNMKSQTNLHSGAYMNAEEPQSFSLMKKDKQEMKKLKQKIQKMKKYEEKLRLMPLKIDIEKQKQAAIMADRQKNKKKYIFLEQKALSDQQIYEQFKDFDMNINKKQLGKKYLEDLRLFNFEHPRNKASSQKILRSSRPQYVNYLDQLKKQRKLMSNNDQFDSIARRANKAKNKQIEKKYLLKQSVELEQLAYKNIEQMRKIKHYPETIKKQQQLDDNFVRAIKAKLALAKIN